MHLLTLHLVSSYSFRHMETLFNQIIFKSLEVKKGFLSCQCWLIPTTLAFGNWGKRMVTSSGQPDLQSKTQNQNKSIQTKKNVFFCCLWFINNSCGLLRAYWGAGSLYTVGCYLWEHENLGIISPILQNAESLKSQRHKPIRWLWWWDHDT